MHFRAAFALGLVVSVSACTPRHPAAPPRSGYITHDDDPTPQVPKADPNALPPLPAITTLRGTIAGRPFVPKTAIVLGLNSITHEATIQITEYDVDCNHGADFQDDNTTFQVSLPWGAAAGEGRAPTALFGVRKGGEWRMSAAATVEASASRAPMIGPNRGRIKVKATRDTDAVEGEIDVILCQR
jgi:hypothetical protein